MITWLFHALLIGTVTLAAAYCIEHALRSAGWPTRNAWSLALLLSLVLPFLPRAQTTAQPVLTIPAFVVGAIADPVVTSSTIVTDLRIAWFVLSVLAATVFVISYVRLRRERRNWNESVLHGERVVISERCGPAVFGLLAPQIVLPRWVLGETAERQRFILRHEAEHVRARDHWLLLLALIALVLMPWNPFIWLQVKRLRYAVEEDCDHRVLAAVRHREAYARLLIDVSSRRLAVRFATALAEHRNGLERRVAMIMSKTVKRPLRAVVLALFGAALAVVACESRVPTDPPVRAEAVTDELPAKFKSDCAGNVSCLEAEPRGDATSSVVYFKTQEPGTQADFDQQPAFTPYTSQPTLQNRDEISRAMIRAYPPKLRDAMLGGTTVVWLLIDTNGDVVSARVREASGHQELDAAAVEVARRMKFTPALADERPVKVWIAVPVVFKTQ